MLLAGFNVMAGSDCRAWMLPLTEDRHVAIGEYEMVHIIPEWVRLQAIPLCPLHCHKVFTWQGQLIPLFDLHAYIRPQGRLVADAAQDVIPVICIVAYEEANRNVGYGALLLCAIPFRTNVANDQICDFPDDNGKWNHIAASCFSDPVVGLTPILDLPRIFCSTPREWTAPPGR